MRQGAFRTQSIGVCVVVVALASIALLTVTGATAAGGSDLTGEIWALSSLATSKTVPGTAVTMRFENGHVSGSTGCNDYSAGYSARLRSLTIKAPIATTRKACSAAISAQENAFLSMLESVKRYDVKNETLTLRGSTGKQLARFEAVSQELGGTTWSVVTYNNGKQAVTTVLAGTRLTAVFAKNGRVSGNSGCNTYNATFETTPPSISFGPIAATMMACATPAGVMNQEAAYLAAFGSAASFTTDGSKLELRTKSGATAVELARA
jgi:heat shock protein HslJ